MSNKAKAYIELAEQTTKRLTSSALNWMEFLNSAGRLYKYPYHEQLMIYAQRPDATACADFDLWNKIMHRYVRRGSKGIALIDSTSDNPKLKYVFDVSDTGNRENSRRLYLWEMQEHHTEPILEMLNEKYNKEEINLYGAFYSIANDLATEYYSIYKSSLSNFIKGSLLEKYDENSVRSVFIFATMSSIAYTLMKRCGLDTDKDFDQNVFLKLFEFNTIDTVTLLGTAVSELSEQVFRQIAVTIAKTEHERSNENERNHLQQERGLSNTRPHIDAVRGKSQSADIRQVWENAKTIPQGTSDTIIQFPAIERETVSPLLGNRPDSEQTTHADNGELTENADTARQDDTTDGMGGLHEQSQITSGRIDTDRTHIQLTPLPTVVEQIQRIAEKSITFDGEEKNEIVITDITDEEVKLTEIPSLPYNRGATVYLENGTPFLIEKITESEMVQEKAKDFRITNEHLGQGSKREKFQNNVIAIATLQMIEKENRPATKEEQEILSQYIGWGGLSEVFDKDNSSFSSEFIQLKNLLSEDEYEMARASTLNAHYTSPTVIKSIYDTVERMGFTKGNILEPACGIGHFFGILPDSMKGSNLYGVELDSITGRIAKQLYPSANVAITGFEKTNFPDSFFDLAIGNVPFGNYKLSEKRYDNKKFLIHDHFFAKALDKVRPNGIIAFITSKGTMDKQSPEVRRYLAQRAELLGAVRLPNNTFLKNAGTEVTSDILFLQKRDRPIDLDRDWIYLDTNEDGIALNSYFVAHPEMILGTMEMKSGQFGMESTCTPIPNADLAEQLQVAMANIEGSISVMDLSDMEIGTDTSILADPTVKNFSYTLVDGEVYYRENSYMVQPNLNQTAKERIIGLVELRECVKAIIHYQLEDYSDDTIKQEQSKLNRLYDSFIVKYGLINSRGNSLAFSKDNSYYLLCSLENVDENGNLKAKADMFTKRTIKKRVVINSVDTASEALALSISEKARVDLVYMSELTGLSTEQLIADLKGVIFRLPTLDNESVPHFVTADEYLSGNVRDKLRTAKMVAKVSEIYQTNVEALTDAQPKDLKESEINVRLGTTWIDKEYIEQFMYELLNTPYSNQRKIKVNYVAFTAEWNITNKNSVSDNNVAAYITYGTSRANAYCILEDTLNLRDIRIYDTVIDPYGKERRFLNKNDTTLAQQKQQTIKDEFQDWIWQDTNRRQALVKKYNEKFNSIRSREYDGQHIKFSGINPEISLRPHQVNAIAHILYGGNTLLAHEVGAGKTFEMVAAVMESKRLGLCQKPLFVVPNHLTEQWASEFLRLYPAANLLVATKKDFETKNRKKFCARIATGEYDAVIIGHSQFERIPVSFERHERLIHEQIDEILADIKEVKANGGEHFTVKQLERTKKGLEERLAKLNAQDRKDDVVTFEQLGVDRLYVDADLGTVKCKRLLN